jgi:DNA-binding beta-propeller fold protein YncE
MKKLYFIFLIPYILLSCTKEIADQSGSFLTGNGVFIINEGNFMGGNGSISFYSYDSLKIYNDIFIKANGRPLGDVPNSITISGENIYIVVNNSGKIEVVDKNTLESVKTITGLNAPRNISVVNSSKAYVSSMYSDSVTILNLTDNSISGHINIRRSSEAISVIRNKAFISNWIGGNEIIVINTDNDKVTDSVKVAMEPESMVIDRDKVLWVLCNGGWKREFNAELIAVNTTTNDIERKLVFPSRLSSPSCLQIDGTGSTLYYLETGVRKLKTDAVSIPSTAYIPESGHYFYKLGINPVNEDILVTDAVDYQQKGHLLIYRSNGTFMDDKLADIIPGMMYFKLNSDFNRR